MGLSYATLYCGVKIVRVIRVEIWAVFFRHNLLNGLDSVQTLQTDRYYGWANGE